MCSKRPYPTRPCPKKYGGALLPSSMRTTWTIKSSGTNSLSSRVTQENLRGLSTQPTVSPSTISRTTTQQAAHHLNFTAWRTFMATKRVLLTFSPTLPQVHQGQSTVHSTLHSRVLPILRGFKEKECMSHRAPPQLLLDLWPRRPNITSLRNKQWHGFSSR